MTGHCVQALTTCPTTYALRGESKLHTTTVQEAAV
jgi:hypothetical protein